VVGYLPFIDAAAPYLTLSALVSKYGKVFSVSMGAVPCVVIADFDTVRSCFSKSEFSGRAPLYLTHGIMKGYGLICAEGALWKSQRKFVAEFMRNVGMSNMTKSGENMEARLLACVESFLAST
jgi:ecdysteroid 25-hydroxylase CYP306A1